VLYCWSSEFSLNVTFATRPKSQGVIRFIQQIEGYELNFIRNSVL